jgi:hypothetical protein
VPTIAPTGLIDPHGLGEHYGRFGFQAKRSARTPLLAAAALLQPGETVEAVVRGKILDRDGVCLLTSIRVLAVNDNEWKPDVIEVEVGPDTSIQGWADERTAALVFTRADDTQLVVDKIGERDHAQEFAQRFRARTGD